MGVLLGGLASLLYGAGDFLGGEGAKRAPAASIVLWAGVISFPLIAGTAFAIGGDPGAADLWLGAAAGAVGALGLVTLFAGLGRGHAAAVAPAAAAVGAIIPVLFGVAAGERPSLLAWAGIAIALPAVALSSWVADLVDLASAGAHFGILAGIGFGGYAVIIDRTSEASGLLPLVPARAATMAVVLVVSAAGVWRFAGWRRVPRLIVAWNGVLDVAGNTILLLALRAGSLALVGVTSSFYPAVTVLLSRIVNGEHVRARQAVGVALTLAALAAIALG